MVIKWSLPLLFLLVWMVLPSCEDHTAVVALQQRTEKLHDEAMQSLGDLQRTKRPCKKNSMNGMMM
ncbi:MAG: hypothetical protein IPL65_03370 [Lewinellaceae bacterium]|nr:hypothetical protein [Lewinellaceae bacterium]